ncbi:MAG TPA: TolC family protein [Kofleriaceae bacterium]|nr:TolC family protein [Kofleriaceae bacterium]
MPGSIARLTAAALLLHAISASADTIDLDLSGALARAHRIAPDAIAARGRIAQAEAGVVSASVAFVTNPEIEADLGPRFKPGRPLDADATLAQNLEPWRRGARRQLASAERAHAQAEGDVTLRDLDLEVSLAFYEAIFASEAADQAKRAEDFAKAAVDAARRRRQAGEITDLDLNLARVALGRAHSATQLSLAERATSVGKLAVLVGAAPADTLVLRGTLAPPAVPASVDAAKRPDVRALDRDREVAAAELAQAIANGRPEVGVLVAYRREDLDSIVMGGLRLTLPVWNRAQGEKAAARAHEKTAAEARDVTLHIAERQIADAMAAYAATKEATDAFERDVLPLLDDSEQLLQKSIDAGQIAISDYLVARQELLTARRDHLERQLALAKAALVVRYVTGSQP